MDELFFFFSSRRRHTRSYGDWSSDVCSSDLFRERTAQATWLGGRCVPYGTGVTFWALGEIVKAHAGILEAESAATASEKLRGAVSEALRDDPEAEWVEGHLRTLVGLA